MRPKRSAKGPITKAPIATPRTPAERLADITLAGLNETAPVSLSSPRSSTLLTVRLPTVRFADEPLSLGLTKALIRRCRLLVTTDSGPRHFAAAFDRPVVSLYGPTFIDWTRTYFDKEICMQKQVPCGPCQLRVCPTDHACMKLLTPPEVLAAVERLLAHSSRHTPCAVASHDRRAS